ncbi:MAG: type IV pilus modification protein PilV [Nitrospira sp. WS110]|nr:type IV pilus modification protein PilV [Nitrospira sp. WS110]
MKPQSEKGFTLAEVMISAAILGVGVMGMAAMQGVSFSKNVDANDLSIVTNVAADMMERIQSNRRFAWAYNNIDTTGPGNCLAGGIPAPAPPMPFFSVAPSVPATRGIQGDCTQWRTLVLATNLLNVRGTVQAVPILPISSDSSAVQLTVQLQWNDRTGVQRQRSVAFRTVIEPE